MLNKYVEKEDKEHVKFGGVQKCIWSPPSVPNEKEVHPYGLEVHPSSFEVTRKRKQNTFVVLNQELVNNGGEGGGS